MNSLLLTFAFGGLLSLIAQLLIDLTSLTPARILVLYVSLGVFLYGTGIYDVIHKIFGYGASTPLIGFGAAIGRGVKDAIDKDGLIGILSGGLSSTAAGICASLVFALVFSFFFKGKPKRL